MLLLLRLELDARFQHPGFAAFVKAEDRRAGRSNVAVLANFLSLNFDQEGTVLLPFLRGLRIELGGLGELLASLCFLGDVRREDRQMDLSYPVCRRT